MDLGCLDLGCIDKHSDGSSLDVNDSVMPSSKIGKNKSMKNASPPSVNTLNKVTSQIKKPPRRKGSPINWFPRKKVDSYLKRKIKLLQEVDGMNSTLDETLGDSNPHYSRVLREKIAVREAAHKAMEARKASLVEASWCRILRASRIESKEAEALLVKAEKVAAEAFEAATAVGVIMYDIPDCPWKHYEIETSDVNGGEYTTHTVTAFFETAFEVDKQVAAAVKAAFVKLASCPSINKDEFKELLRKISQNPGSGESNTNLTEFSSECESDTGTEFEASHYKDKFSSHDLDGEVEVGKERKRKIKRQPSKKFNMAKLVDMMLERLRCLREDELSSLATIVATCGLNAALTEAENSKHLGSAADYTTAMNFPRRMSSFGAGRRNSNVDRQMRKKQVETELPSLDKFLVKRLTRLEREVQEAKESRRNEATDGCEEKTNDEKVCSIGTCNTTDLGGILVKHSSKFEKEIEEARENSGEMFEKDRKVSKCDSSSSEVVPDFGSMLKKHVSKLEKEIEEAKTKYSKLYERNGKKPERRVHNQVVGQTRQDGTELPSLDKFLVKHVSRLEREVQAAKDGSKMDPAEGGGKEADRDQVGKENIDLNHKGNQEIDTKQMGTGTAPGQIPRDCSDDTSIPFEKEILESTEALSLQVDDSKGVEDSLDKILVKPVHRLEREKMQALSMGVQRYRKRDGGSSVPDCESLDKILVKCVSRLEKEKMDFSTEEEVTKVKRKDTNAMSENSKGGLEHILVKHKSRLEKEKMGLAGKEEVIRIKRKDTSTQSEKTEGSLDQILVKHESRLEKEKIAAAAQQLDDQIKHSSARRQAREKELQEAWGGQSLGNSMRPHLSKLQHDKASLDLSHSVTTQGSLDQILVKRESRLEKEKIAAAQQLDDQIKHSSARRLARERELLEAWGGQSLGNSMLPHLSKLQRDKAAWLKAEEDERSRAMEQ